MIDLGSAEMIAKLAYASHMQELMDLCGKYDVSFRVEPMFNRIIFTKLCGVRSYSKAYAVEEVERLELNGVSFAEIVKNFSEEADRHF